jgi:integrase
MFIKTKKKTNKIQLRDPVCYENYAIFLKGAGDHLTQMKKIRIAQLKIIYTILYHTGLRINETRLITKNDILNAITTGRILFIRKQTGIIFMLFRN